MIMYISNSVRVSNPTSFLKDWVRCLSVPNPEYTKKKRMGFWTGNTPQEIKLYETDGEDLILPYGTLSMIPNVQDVAILYQDFSSEHLVDYGDTPMNLYDYQQEAVDCMLFKGCGILQAPAGSGKTQMGIAMIQRLGVKTLWLCHTKDLLNQSMERAKQYIPDNLIGTITEGQVNIGEGVTFATVQTMANLDLLRYRDTWNCVIVDECHRVSGSPTSVTRYQKVLSNLNAMHKYGLSATVYRSDGLVIATKALLGGVMYRVTEEDVADKIVPVMISPVATGTELNLDSLNPDGTLNYQKFISSLACDYERNKLIAGTIQEGVPSIILSDRLNHLSAIREKLPPDMKKDSVLISGKMTTKKGKAERGQVIEDMRTGKKKYLFATYALCKEGLDIPCLEHLHMTTPVKDYAVVTQSLGRVARRYEGKKQGRCVDYVDEIAYCYKAYKKRCTIYRKNHCTFEEFD